MYGEPFALKPVWYISFLFVYLMKKKIYVKKMKRQRILIGKSTPSSTRLRVTHASILLEFDHFSAELQSANYFKEDN